jgi:AcrR family transcriptional regulator
MADRERRRQRDLARRERAILAAALELFRDDAWQAVTVEEIAQRARIGKGTIYKHFASKDEIYARLAADFQERALDRVDRVDPALPADTRLRELIAAYWEHHRGATEQQRVVQYCGREDFRCTLSEATQARLIELDARFEAQLEGLLRAGVAQGALRHARLGALKFGLLATLAGALQLLAAGRVPEPPDPGDGPDRQLEDLTEFILAGLLRHDPPAVVAGLAAAPGETAAPPP